MITLTLPNKKFKVTVCDYLHKFKWPVLTSKSSAWFPKDMIIYLFREEGSDSNWSESSIDMLVALFVHVNENHSMVVYHHPNHPMDYISLQGILDLYANLNMNTHISQTVKENFENFLKWYMYEFQENP